jgi:tRNA(Arg) A34 adenosine deaminase TadA
MYCLQRRFLQRETDGSLPQEDRRPAIEGNPSFMHRAIALATGNVLSHAGGPFGAVIVRDGQIIASGVNQVACSNDPTAHAEVVAIRAACRALDDFQLTGCVIYTSCEPCPMCLAALYWARCDAIFYGNSAADAADAGFDDALLYEEVSRPLDQRRIPMTRLLADEAMESFDAWRTLPDRIDY